MAGRVRARGRLTVKGMPLMKPPYGQITAIDVNKGEIIWQVPHGETPDEVRNNPALAGMTSSAPGSGQSSTFPLTDWRLVLPTELPQGDRPALQLDKRDPSGLPCSGSSKGRARRSEA